MVTIDAKSAIDELKRSFSFLSAAKMREVISISINKTLLKTRTQTAKNVLEVFNIDKSVFLSGTRIQKAKSGYGKQYGYLLADTHPLNITNFAARQVSMGTLTEFIGKRSGKNKGGFASKKIPLNDAGIYLEIYRGKEERLPGAFMMFFSNGNAAAMARGADSKGRFMFTDPRLPIDGITSKSIASMIYNPRVAQPTANEITNLFVTETTKQLTKAVQNMHSHAM